MNQVLYRKYRPQTFADVVGQEHITTTLKNALASDQVAHAYLFTGPRGTGKTSVARILAKAVNCTAGVKEKPAPIPQPVGLRIFKPDGFSSGRVGELHRLHQKGSIEPCNKCDACIGITNGAFLDLIEIDAASNRGIDDVRELREKVNFQPSVGKKKVYILDEVHMLTKEAFNALLKTLEEPPAHVMFILCTTEPYKVPETIISRCQRFDFQLSDENTLQGYILENAEKEGVKLEKEAASLLGQSAQGAYRDAIGLLEQIITYKPKTKKEKTRISLEDVRKLLGLPEQGQIEELLTKVVQKDTQNLLKFVGLLYDSGINLHQFIKETMEYLRRGLLSGLEGKEPEIKLKQDEIVRLITLLNKAEQEMKFAVIPQLPLELALLEFVSSLTGSAIPAVNLPAQVGEKPVPIPQPVGLKGKPDGFSSGRVGESALPARSDARRAGRLAARLEELWPQILTRVKPKNHTIEALLKGCRPEGLKDDILTLHFFYPFHKEKIEEARNRRIVEEAVIKVLGREVKVRCVLSDKPKTKTQAVAGSQVSSEISEEEMKKIAEEIFGNENSKSQIPN